MKQPETSHSCYCFGSQPPGSATTWPETGQGWDWQRWCCAQQLQWQEQGVSGHFHHQCGCYRHHAHPTGPDTRWLLQGSVKWGGSELALLPLPPPLPPGSCSPGSVIKWPGQQDASSGGGNRAGHHIILLGACGPWRTCAVLNSGKHTQENHVIDFTSRS